MKPILKRLLRRIADAGRPPRNIVNPQWIHGLNIGMMNETAQVAVLPEAEESRGFVSFGREIYIGKDVEITAIGPGSIRIGDHTSFQDRCQIFGDVRIGAHCLFARNILVQSTIHRFRENAAWLIHDQDRQFLADIGDRPERCGRTIWIEDDCWLGWGCTVMPGVYIGRGAVIGANSVVTRDVPPYQVHGGAPNTMLSHRLAFDPPQTISALDDCALPYFYRGFRHERSNLARSRALGGIELCGDAALVLAHADAPLVRIRGQAPQTGEPVRLRIRINGWDCGEHLSEGAPFELVMRAPSAGEPHAVPVPLRNTTYVEILGAAPQNIILSGADVSPTPDMAA
jgi:acetyltransferase-like isoleucine patch superfamily enzyme